MVKAPRSQREAGVGGKKSQGKEKRERARGGGGETRRAGVEKRKESSRSVADL